MKRLFTIASLVALTLASCAKDEIKSEEKGEGSVTIACNVATDVTETRANVSCTTPAEEDFALVIEGVSLGYKQEYASVADFDENSLNDGQYIFEFFTADGQVVCYKQLIRRIAE